MRILSRNTLSVPNDDTDTYFFDLYGHASDRNVAGLIRRIAEEKCRFGQRATIATVGSYPLSKFLRPKIKTVGIVGHNGGMNRLLHDFFGGCGPDDEEEYKYTVLVGGVMQTKDSDAKRPYDVEVDYRRVAGHSDAIIFNRMKGSEALKAARTIKPSFEGGRKLLVVNTSNPGDIMDDLLKLYEGSEVLFMDASLSKRVGTFGQRVIFIDYNAEPGSFAAEFVNIYERAGMHAVFSGHDDFATQRGFAMAVPMVASMLVFNAARDLKVGEKVGLDFAKLAKHSSLGEELFFTAAQSLHGDPKAIAMTLRRYFKSQAGDVLVDNLKRMLALTEADEDEIARAVTSALNATKERDNLGGTIKRLFTALLECDAQLDE